MKKLLVVLMFLAGGALALPDALRDVERVESRGAAALDWRQWGRGEMTWFGFSIYRATLWVAGDDPASAPSALQLDYHRDIPSERLVQTSIDEMRRLGADETQLRAWEAELKRVFPDVKEGDSIVGVHLPGRAARFYYRGVPSGEVADPEFARRFFGIWLDPKSRSPELRAALLSRPAGS